MRLLGWDEKRGTAILLPEDVDDLWSLYLLVEPGDVVKARTTREKKAEGARSRGRRKAVKLAVRVEKKAFDALMGRLRLLGVIVEAPAEFEDDIGKHHALSVRPGLALSLQKPTWGRYHREILKRACAPRPKPLLVLCLDDEDFCVALVGMREVEVLAEGENTHARAGAPSKEEALRPFLREALRALKDAWEVHARPVAILGPALERDLFLSLLRSEEPKLAEKVVAVRGVSTGGLPGIYEALRAGVLAKALSEARLVREAEAVRELLARLGRGDNRVAYGLEEVRRACSYGAVEVLLVADALLRDASEEERRELEAMMAEAEARGGRVMIVSSGHEAGRNLLSLGGIAALLRFPVS